MNVITDDYTKRIERLSEKQRRLLAFRLQQYGVEMGAAQEAPADTRIAAYLAAETGDENALIESVRAYLKLKLPEYMLPSAFVVLEKLPQTPNGKVDRAALPDPFQDRPAELEAFSEPVNEVEKSLALQWGKLLGMDAIGRQDNFFELGGHSLLLTRLLAQLSEQYGLEIPIRVFFENPTIAGLADWIEMQAGSGTPSATRRETFEI